ncbi:MAG: biotin--[acetyl-CoA-carboxylase] ligase [Verrucomicrobiia bacterium]|jgi:BirA family biotin operon repressor/biotin-[acetyl-CoA-carboxylase] ligase
MSVDAKILTAMREAGDGAVAGTELSQQLGISRAAIWARIEELRTLGYEITASPHQGYRLLNTPDVLHGDDLVSRVGSVNAIGRDIRVFRETESTSDIIEKLARDGVAEGAVVFAESQTRGRGRLGRKWMSPPDKGLWFSILLRPNCAPQAVTQLTIAVSVSLVRAIQSETGIRADIKWPNDILIGGKKVAGILTELSAEVDTVKHVVIGIGMDVNLAADEFPPELREIATSLAITKGGPIDRPALAAAILKELDADYARIKAGQFKAVSEEWVKRCSTLGQNVAILTGSDRRFGRAESIDADGALLLRTEHGHLERITGGDVSLEK